MIIKYQQTYKNIQLSEAKKKTRKKERKQTRGKTNQCQWLDVLRIFQERLAKYKYKKINGIRTKKSGQVTNVIANVKKT